MHGLARDAKGVFAFADQELSATVSLEDYMSWQDRQWDAQQHASGEEDVIFDANKSTEELYAHKDQVMQWDGIDGEC